MKAEVGPDQPRRELTNQFSEKTNRLPFDQHCLVALCAPRPCLLSSALNDAVESAWAMQQTFLSADWFMSFWNIWYGTIHFVMPVVALASPRARFQPVYVNEPSTEDAVAILRGLKEKYEIFHGVRITDDAILSAVNLSSRYIADRFLPDKAVDLIDE